MADKDLVPVSEFFAIKKISGSRLLAPGWEGLEIFARLPGQEARYLGFAEGQPPTVNYAVSKDGRALVFRHSAWKARSGTNLEPGIYQYVHGTGLKQLYPESKLAGQVRRQFERPIPSDVLPFSLRTTYTPEDLLRALKATGEELPLALVDATALHVAAFDGRPDDCEKLVRAGAQVDATTYWNFTALDLAIIRDQEEAAIRLLDLGADPYAGRYPTLNRAVMLGRMKVVRAMLDRGVDVDRGDAWGYRPLHLAVFAGTRLVGGVNEFFPNAETPRSILDRRVSGPLVQMLLDKGAKPELRDKYGKTALASAGVATPAEAMQRLQAVTPLQADACDESIFYKVADAHPGIRWEAPASGASADAALGCILRSAKDSATMEVQRYMSSGLYRFVKECGSEDGMVVHRLFEYKTKAQPYLLRLHKDLYVEPRTYVLVKSRRHPAGSYHHSVEQASNDDTKLPACKPDA